MVYTNHGKQRIINCVGQLPYKVELGSTNDEWNIVPITGNSPLYSSLEYLSCDRKSKDYEEHVVGWTGEINREGVPSRILSSGNKSELGSETMSNEEDPLYLTNDQISGITRDLRKYGKGENANYHIQDIHPVWLLCRNQKRWREFADNVVWSTFHYILKFSPDSCEKENQSWYDYVRFNEAYAMKIGEIYRKGDIIWIHDYYLLLLPQLLRMKFSDQDLTIAYYHHSPWPSNEYFRVLPRRKQILDGLMGANRVCFQNEGFARHFVSSCKRLLDSTSKKSKNTSGIDQYQITAYGGDIIVDSLPVGINRAKLLEEAFTKDIDEKVLAIKDAFHDKKIIVGRDRLDPVRGVVQKLRAFETFLSMYPEWREQVVFIQVSIPSIKGGTAQTIRLEQQVNELVTSINTQYGSLNFSPVHHYYIRIPKDVYLSLLRVADLCIITSAREGSNTTALEYVTVKSHMSTYDCYGSPLILSEFSGTSTVLKDAMIINPWDSVAVARNINDAFCLSREERNALENKLWPEVPTVQDWTDNFLSTLNDIVDGAYNIKDRKITPALNRPVLLENYKKAKRRLFLFDYDGTLTPIVRDPAAAIPSARLISILRKLASEPRNRIWIISGRDQTFLNKWLGSRVPQLGLSAEHGCFYKGVDDDHWVNLTQEFNMSWQEKVGSIMDEFTRRTPGSFIEKKKVALTWHYRRSDPELGEFYALELGRELSKLCTEYDVDVMAGKANIEVRPKFVNKGEIVKRLVWNQHGLSQDILNQNMQELTVEKKPDFTFCLGDDFTDEDMFRELNDIETIWRNKYRNEIDERGGFVFYPCTVGSASKNTVAKAHLTDPQQVLDTLGLLVGDVSLFQSAGTVELDSRGHVKHSESSIRSERAGETYALKRQQPYRDLNKV